MIKNDPVEPFIGIDLASMEISPSRMRIL